MMVDGVEVKTILGFPDIGEKNGQAKLTEQDVRMIIYMYRTGLFTQKEIAKQYGITRQCIALILNRKNWKHIWATM